MTSLGLILAGGVPMGVLLIWALCWPMGDSERNEVVANEDGDEQSRHQSPRC